MLAISCNIHTRYIFTLTKNSIVFCKQLCREFTQTLLIIYFFVGTMKSGTALLCKTFSVTLPTSISFSQFRLCDPITMISASISFAVSKMESAKLPSVTSIFIESSARCCFYFSRKTSDSFFNASVISVCIGSISI